MRRAVSRVVLMSGSLTVIAFAEARSQEPGPLTIGSVTARAGETASGYIEVPAGVDSATRIPISVVRGRERGPTLVLVAGTHGSEVAPVIALQGVRRELDRANLLGTVILVHVANLPSFLGRTILYGPIDRKNLNRVYPGRPDGTVSERIAHGITREVIEPSDYLGLPVDEMVQLNVRSVFRLLRYLGMLPGAVERVEHPVWIERTEVLTSPVTGLWYPLVERGHTVVQGTTVGYLTDFFGEHHVDVRSPFAGEVLYVIAGPAMSQGQPVAMIGQSARE